MSDLLRRQSALEKTLAKYRGKRLDFRTADCVRMARFHLLAMGHKPPALPSYQSAIGARRALKQAGGMTQIFDRMLERIPHARMMAGDIAILEGEDGLECVVISTGYKVMGWHQDSDEIVNLIPSEIKAAWRA